MTEITPWHWVGFIVCILFFIALDLGMWDRLPARLRWNRLPACVPVAPSAAAAVLKQAGSLFHLKRALAWSGFWVILALLFALGLGYWHGRAEAVQFTTGYLIELSLSLDNILVIALIFSGFQMLPALQHHALVWGILGALVMRGTMIGVGAALIHRFAWILYILGFFLVFTGIRMIFARRGALDLEKEPLVRLVRRCFPIAADFDGLRFFTTVNGRRALTPLALVVLLVESSDLLFAFDSVPAVFSVTRNAFIVFTSNVFAILGLRSLYFLLAGALEYFRYLKFGLAVVLVFVGAKMLLEPHGHGAWWFQCEISNGVSLLTIFSILVVTMILSVVATRREGRMPG
jgi:tellurite resistance protein TerC